ncbi:hypothetical protein Tco_0292782, partial [Tanacetum coccineum]
MLTAPATCDPSSFNNNGQKRSFTDTKSTTATQITDADTNAIRQHVLNRASISTAENCPFSSASQEGGYFSFVDTQIIEADTDARRQQILNRASISTVENYHPDPSFQI